ncbi:hypothetical protein [Streptomyces laurentii]
MWRREDVPLVSRVELDEDDEVESEPLGHYARRSVSVTFGHG